MPLVSKHSLDTVYSIELSNFEIGVILIELTMLAKKEKDETCRQVFEKVIHNIKVQRGA